jgi:hypothetical protein
MKQDRTFARTAADIERKYNFGKSFAEVMGLAEETRKIAEQAETAVSNLDSELTREEIFRRLTNDWTEDGVYRDADGKVYISADMIRAGIIKSKDGKQVVIDLDNGEVDLVGKIETVKTSLDGWLYRQNRVDGTGVYAVVYELVNGEYKQIGFTELQGGMVAMEDMNGNGTYYGISETLMGNANGSQAKVAIGDSNAQVTLVANNDTASDPVMLVATPSRRYLLGLTEPIGDSWAANKKYVDDLMKFTGYAGDCNTIYNNGLYRVNESTTNCYGTNGMLIVHNWGDSLNNGITFQMFVDHEANVYKRIKWYTNGWTTWNAM